MTRSTLMIFQSIAGVRDVMDLTSIPGIGKTFERDFRRVGITSVDQLKGKSADDVFGELRMANAAEDHATSKNYLYVIRMCIYFANGDRDPAKLNWSAWKDKAIHR